MGGANNRSDWVLKFGTLMKLRFVLRFEHSIDFAHYVTSFRSPEPTMSAKSLGTLAMICSIDQL